MCRRTPPDDERMEPDTFVAGPAKANIGLARGLAIGLTLWAAGLVALLLL